MAVKSAPIQITDSIFLPNLFKTICGKMLSNLAISFTKWHTGMAYSCAHYQITFFSEWTGNMLLEVMALDMPPHTHTQNMAEFLKSSTSLCLTKLRKQANLEVFIINQEIWAGALVRFGTTCGEHAGLRLLVSPQKLAHSSHPSSVRLRGPDTMHCICNRR